jgi:4-amino-4-deoxy-L-arabinose transferase-like glycosyltransferase
VCLGALLVATATVYTWRLDSAPIYVAPDEAHFTAHASSIAQRGTDLHGNRLPLFFRITDPLIDGHSMQVWYQPFLFYVMAANFRAQPVSEWSARLPVALIGVANVLLMFLVARRLFNSDGAALVAAAALAMTPAHFLFSRQAVDYLCPLPFVLGWLWFLLGYFETRRRGLLLAAAATLGLGLYTYISSWLVMPLLLVLSLTAARADIRTVMQSLAAFVLPTVCLLPWWAAAGPVATDAIARYKLGSSEPVTDPVAAILNFSLAERVSLYWSYFNPSFLVFAGGGDLLMATSRAGVFLVPAAALMAWGAYALWRQRSPAAMVILSGFILAPLPIVLVMPEAPGSSIGRAMTLIVFGILMAAAGAVAMWQQSGWARAAAGILVVMMPAQFGVFRADYFTEYQERSSVRFDGLATRDVMDAVLTIERGSPVPLVLLLDDGYNTGIRWLFYTLKSQRPDLWARTRYFRVDALETPGPPVGTLLLMPANDPRSAKLLAAGCSKVAAVNRFSGEPATDIFRRDR